MNRRRAPLCPVARLVDRRVGVTAACAAALSGIFGGVAHAQAASATTTAQAAPIIDPAQVPTYMDVVQRGMRLRVDLGGRYGAVGLPDPPVRLEVDDTVDDRDDIDVTGVVIFGYDRMFGAPVQGEIFGDFNVDANADSAVSPFLDDQSAAPRLRLYSAFIGLSASPGEPALRPFQVNLGRMTELVESPITYDGLSVGARLRFGRTDSLNAKLWGGLDAPQRIVDDPFSRTSQRSYAERFSLADDFVSNPGAWEVERAPLTDPNLNVVGGLVVDGRFAGVGFVVTHTVMPALSDTFGADLLPLQRSKIGASYRYDSDWLLATAGLDTQMTDFAPRNVTLRGDAMTGDGTTRVGLVGRLQFAADVTAYDATFAARDPAAVFKVADVNALESLRVRDQIRHLNFGPPQEHVYASVDVERQLPAAFQVLGHARVRHHLDDADVDMFRTNLYEMGGGLSWNPGYALDVGAECNAGSVYSGEQDGLAYDLAAEGVSTFIEPRVWVRGTLLDGHLRNLSEVFVRRSDVRTKALDANGQWGGAVATTTTYDVTSNWAVSLRVDGDALSPIDSLNSSTYFGALVATSVRF